MNTMLKRVISLMLCFVLMAGYLPAGAFAAEEGETVTSEVTVEPTGTVSTETTGAAEATTAPATVPTTIATEAPTEGTTAPAEETEPSTEGTEPSTEATEATEPAVIAVTGITLDVTELEVGMGESEPVKLTATVLPEDATDKTVTWTSSEPGVASVDKNGVVSFGYMGEAVITATAGEFSATCAVTVSEGDWSAYVEDGTTYVLAGSDFQARGGHDAGAEIVSGLLEKIQEDYPVMHGFLFAGDYDVNYSDSDGGQEKLQETVQSVYGTAMDEIYVQGNHDGDSLVGSNCTSSGANDAEDYGVFVINEKDYMWYNNDEATIKNTAENLEAYLNAKVSGKYSKPIFVISHLPLHYSMRTRTGGGDGKHANYIFDVLNEAGEDGLNIIFLFGHNHSHGWDDYLGGAAIFLKPGDKINIAQKSTTVFQEETLAFTYMNAGYVGYYGDSYTSTVDKTLTMTTFAITDTDVTISRYDSNGAHNLKSAGVYNVEYPDSAYYTTNTATVGTPYTLTLKQFAPDVTLTDEATGIAVTAPGITGLAVRAKDASAPVGYSAYASYDITPAGYTPGDTATVMIPAPEGFDTSKRAVVLDQGVKIGEDTNISDGITFTTTHFSEYVVAQVDDRNGAMESGSLSSATVSSTSVSKVESGVYYLIEAANDKNSGGKRTLTGTANGSYLKLDGIVSESNTNLWYITSAKGGYYVRFGGPDGKYLTIGNKTARLTDTPTVITIGDESGTTWSLKDGSYYLNQHGGRTSSNVGGWDGNDDGSKWNLYKVVIGDAEPVTLMVAPATMNLYPDVTKNLTATVLVNNAETSDYTITWSSSNTAAATVDGKDLVTGVADGDATITATLTGANGQKVNGTVAVEIPVTVVTRVATSIQIDSMTGTVQRTSKATTATGSTLTVTYDDDSTESVPVTVSMLTKADGEGVSTGAIATYGNLTVTYAGQTITGYTLNVVAKTGNNYPEYPNEGAVKVNKTGTGIDFQASGIAQIEVSASGVPMKKGADVIVMLDLSSSMTNTVGGKTRLTVLQASLQNLMAQLQKNGEDGQPMDIRIAVADFNRYYTDSSSPYYINSADHLTGGSIRNNTAGTNQVYTGSRTLDAGAFVDVHNLTETAFNGLNTQSGTNYDYAFDAVYQLGEAVTAANEAAGEERDLFVIFMSDGAPFQFNYFSSQSDGNGAAYWNNWLQGTMTDEMFANGSNKSYYNEDGKHWMAEAIKGAPEKAYPVIRKNNAADNDGDNWVNVNGLGAKMYSIGFCLAVDKDITVASMDTVIRNIASEEKYYFRADSATDLNNAFTAIGSDIAYAAYNARFVDQMGDNYNLQLKTASYQVVENGSTVNKTLAPKIEIITYDIYTKADEDAGTIPEGKHIGDRKGTYKVLETVTFSADGTQAYSDQIDGGKTNILADGTNDAYVKGVIYAKYFLYNTNIQEVTVDGVQIPTGKDSANLTTGSTKVLPSETFYWKMGTVQSSELAMRYYVYLDGSMEGTREAGSYPTNEFATLYYDNYLGNPCYKDTVSPVMAWKEANVSYAFYLVNEDGEIIVNQTTGQTGSFANKIAVTTPVVYETIMLNNIENVSVLDVAAASEDVLPRYYTLYDKDAVYKVTINSNTTGKWDITLGDGKTQSTYVTQYKIDDASAYSNALTNETIGDDYTHTVVWFAVVWSVGAHPDSVVVDYGLPVDISVLTNDMFGENGKLAGVGAYTEGIENTTAGESMESGFGADYTGTYGTAKADTSTGKVRYTLNTMQMDSYEKFAYAVNYTGNENTGYYYDIVTVIPATTIYYEDSFLTYGASNTQWVDEGTAIAGATQSEDRPGKYSLTDANNIYGYDGVNLGMSTFSLGTAKKVHVDANSYATAEFTFKGTGFDVIGMTSSDTGLLVVQVYQGDTLVKTVTVDTYYGYTAKYHNVTYTYEAPKWEEKVQNVQLKPAELTQIPTEAPADGNNIIEGCIIAENGKYFVVTYMYDSENRQWIIDESSRQFWTPSEKQVLATDLPVNGENKELANGQKLTYHPENYNKYTVTYTDKKTGYVVKSWKLTDDGKVKVVTFEFVDGHWAETKGEELSAKPKDAPKALPENPADGATVSTWKTYFEVDPSNTTAIYQVPVIQVEELPYNTYRAVLTATYADVFDHKPEGTTEDGNGVYTGYDLYLDAIRIYDPANDGAQDDDTVIEDAYKVDGEGWPSYIELRNKLISNATLGNADTNTVVTGLVFIDGNAEVGDAYIGDYISYGPNNEVYLAPGQRVAFKLSTPANVANIHIGIKSANGAAGTYTITNIAENADTENKVSAGQYYNVKTDTVNTTTDMYYDLTGWKNDIIVISNTGDRYNTTGIISLTNIKSTYTSNPKEVTVASLEEELSNNETEVYVTRGMATLTLRALNAVEPEESVPGSDVPETTVPEATEPEMTEPEETEPEETEPEESKPDKEAEKIQKQIQKALEKAAKEAAKVAKELQKAAEKAAKALSKLFGSWF